MRQSSSCSPKMSWHHNIRCFRTPWYRWWRKSGVHELQNAEVDGIHGLWNIAAYGVHVVACEIHGLENITVYGIHELQNIVVYGIHVVVSQWALCPFLNIIALSHSGNQGHHHTWEKPNLGFLHWFHCIYAAAGTYSILIILNGPTSWNPWTTKYSSLWNPWSVESMNYKMWNPGTTKYCSLWNPCSRVWNPGTTK